MTGWNKSVRALFAALITTLLAVLMHLGAGGVVAPTGVALVFILVLWAAMIFAGRRLGYLSLAAILGLGQVLMHLSMGWFGAMGAAQSASANGSGQPSSGSALAQSHAHQHLGHETGTLDLSHAGTMAHSHGAHGAGASMSGGAGADLGMLLAHIAAVLVTAVILKRGEDIVLTILQLALGPVATAIQALAEAAGTLAEFPARAARVEFRLPQAITSAVIGPNYRRGPPALV